MVGMTICSGSNGLPDVTPFLAPGAPMCLGLDLYHGAPMNLAICHRESVPEDPQQYVTGSDVTCDIRAGLGVGSAVSHHKCCTM